MTKRKTIKRPNDFKTTNQTVNRYKGHLVKGLGMILELPRDVQQWILYCLVSNDTLFSQYTNSHINKYFIEMETNDEFRDKLKQINLEETDGHLWDIQLTPMIRGKIVSGLQDLIGSGGRRKWEKVLSEISKGFREGNYI